MEQIEKILVVELFMKFSIIILVLTISSVAFSQVKDWNGLAFEISPQSNTDKNFFNRDNKIYQPGKEFLFYYLFSKKGENSYCKVNERGDTDRKKWTFVEPNNSDSLTIKFIGIKILDGYGGLDNLFPEYSQTIIQQGYYAPDKTLLFEGLTGLAENSANVWIHPFRGKMFSVTELSPFPFVKFPLKIGSQWNWKLEDIQERWSDPRFVEYKGTLTGNYSHQITKKIKLKTLLGKLDCYVIEGKATNRVGSVFLKSYFNPKFGFVRLEYTNIDESNLTVELVKVRQYEAEKKDSKIRKGC